MTNNKDRMKMIYEILSRADVIIKRFWNEKEKRWIDDAVLDEHREELQLLSTRIWFSSRSDNASDIRACANALLLLGYQAGLEDRLDVWRDQL